MIDVRDGRRGEHERAVWLDFWLTTLSNMFGQCEHNLDKRAISRKGYLARLGVGVRTELGLVRFV